jgi:hypothetical protein
LRFTSKLENMLEHYGGNGYSYSTEDGTFEVRVEGKGNKKFNKLSEAREYFDSINEERFIWDVTTIPELLDGYVHKKQPTQP